MQYIQNIVFWLTAAMDAATTAITLGIIVFLICLFGIGLGVGRIWNAKWKLNASALGISCIMGLLAAILIMVHTAMGFVQETIVSPRVKITVKTNIVNDLANNNSLMKEAFKQALDTLKKTGENTNSLDPKTATDFSFTEDTPENEANKEKFLNSVIKTISGTAPQAQKDKAKKKLASLSDMAPFSYGYAPISRDADGDVAKAFNKELSDQDYKVDPKNPYWFVTIIKGMVEESFKGLEKTVCQKIDSQRSSALILMIVLMLIQTALISWLAYTDICPRRIQID